MSPNLWGELQPVEPADVVPDPREARTFADELAAELRITARIQRDPLSGHFPFTLETVTPHGRIRHHGLSRDYRVAPKLETLTGASRRLARNAAAVLTWLDERRRIRGLDT